MSTPLNDHFMQGLQEPIPVIEPTNTFNIPVHRSHSAPPINNKPDNFPPQPQDEGDSEPNGDDPILDPFDSDPAIFPQFLLPVPAGSGTNCSLTTRRAASDPFPDAIWVRAWTDASWDSGAETAAEDPFIGEAQANRTTGPSLSVSVPSTSNRCSRVRLPIREFTNRTESLAGISLHH